MNAEDYKVSGIYLRVYLAGVRKLTGKQYRRLLQQAGLDHYCQKYPVADLKTAGTGKNLIELNQAIITYIGPDLFGLFLRNLGYEFAHLVATTPTLKTATQALCPITDRAGLSQVLTLILRLNKETLGEQISLAEASNPHELILTYRQCLYCAQRGPVDKPVCIVINTFYKEMIHCLTGIRCHIEEIRCGAMFSERDCTFLVRLV